jgi:hypothetical protein
MYYEENLALKNLFEKKFIKNPESYGFIVFFSFYSFHILDNTGFKKFFETAIRGEYQL